MPSTLHAVVGTLVAALLLASIWFWATALRRLNAGENLLPLSPRPDPPWGLADLLITMLAVFGIQLFASLLVRTILDIPAGARLEELAPVPRAAVLLVGALGMLLALALSVAWVVGRCGARLPDLGIRVHSVARDVRLGAAAFVMIAPVVYGIQWSLVQFVESKHPLLELLKEHPDPWFFMMSGFSAVLVAPVVEEYLFRVLLQGWLERIPAFLNDPAPILLGSRCSDATPLGKPPHGSAAQPPRSPVVSAETIAPANPYATPRGAAETPPTDLDDSTHRETIKMRSVWPIVFSSATFAGAHWSHGPDPIPLFVLACALGTIYQRTGSILPCIVIHSLLNLCSLTALWLAVFEGTA